MLDPLLSLDASLFHLINALPHPAGLTFIMKAVTTLGAGSAIWFVLALVVALRGDPDAALRVTLSLIVAAVAVGVTIKPVVGRDRPTPMAGIDTPVADQFASASFPSGHAAGAAAGAYSLSRIWVTRAPIVWALALLIAASRVYLGAHYPLDVVAGLMVGLGCAIVVTGRSRIESRRIPARNVKAQERRAGTRER